MIVTIPSQTIQDTIQQARLLNALAHPVRLQILNLLSKSDETLCVTNLVSHFKLEQPTISHHLRILRDAGIVDCHKSSTWTYYYVRQEALSQVREMIDMLAGGKVQLRDAPVGSTIRIPGWGGYKKYTVQPHNEDVQDIPIHDEKGEEYISPCTLFVEIVESK